MSDDGFDWIDKKAQRRANFQKRRAERRAVRSQKINEIVSPIKTTALAVVTQKPKPIPARSFQWKWPSWKRPAWRLPAWRFQSHKHFLKKQILAFRPKARQNESLKSRLNSIDIEKSQPLSKWHIPKLQWPRKEMIIPFLAIVLNGLSFVGLLVGLGGIFSLLERGFNAENYAAMIIGIFSSAKLVRSHLKGNVIVKTLSAIRHTTIKQDP